MRPIARPQSRNMLTAIILLPPILLYYCTNGYLIPRTTAPVFGAAAGPDHYFLDRASELTVALAAFLMGLFAFRTIRVQLRRVPYLVYLVVLAASSAVWASDRLHSLEASVVLASLLVIAAYCRGRLRNNDLLYLLTYTGAAAMIISVLLVNFAPDIGIDPGQFGAWRGVFGQKNNCGAFSGLFVFSALNYQGNGLSQKVTRYLCLTLGMFVIVMSQSRTGWLLLGVGVAITVTVRVLKRFKSRDAIALCVSLLAIVLIALMLAYTHLGVVLLLLGKDPTLTQRTVIWRIVWQTVSTHPLLGYGFSSFWQGLKGESANVIMVTGWMEGQAQNGFLDLWLQLGLAGIILFVLALRQAVRDLARLWTRADPRHLAWCSTIVVTTLLYNIGESSILFPKNISWFFLVIACMSVSTSAEENIAVAQHAEKSGSVALQYA